MAKDLKQHNKVHEAGLPADRERRRVLRGLSAVPAMATLSAVGGSAAAASLLCSEKGAAILPTPVAPDGTTAPIYVCEDPANPLTLGNTVPQTTANIADPEAGVITSSPVQVVTDQANTAAIGTTNNSRNCVIYLDSGGQPTFDSSAGSAVGASCMISLGITTPP